MIARVSRPIAMSDGCRMPPHISDMVEVLVPDSFASLAQFGSALLRIILSLVLTFLCPHPATTLTLYFPKARFTLSDAMSVLPSGVPGDLCLRSAGVSWDILSKGLWVQEGFRPGSMRDDLSSAQIVTTARRSGSDLAGGRQLDRDERDRPRPSSPELQSAWGISGPRYTPRSPRRVLA